MIYFPFVAAEPKPFSPCDNCGANTECVTGTCRCLPEFRGDPYSGCRPECVINSDCLRSQACLRNKCVDPCIGTCGFNALCSVVNHVPICTCPSNMTGNAFVSCFQILGNFPNVSRKNYNLPLLLSTSTACLIFLAAPLQDPCNMSPCGPNSQCRKINEQAVCSCVPGFLGVPPNCRPECTISSDCRADLACSNQRCIDPCPGTCGIRAQCKVINHNPLCTCQGDLTGDPFIACFPQRKYLILLTKI